MSTGGWLVWLFGGAMILNSHAPGSHVQATLGDLFAFMGLMWMFYGHIDDQSVEAMINQPFWAASREYVGSASSHVTSPDGP